jgi:hypothetical protein
MPAGRPRKFTDPEEMQKGIDSFFEECDANKVHPTIAGLAYHLGFEDRHGLDNYKDQQEFSATIKRAKLKIERHLEQRLYEPSPTGTIFNLKNNFGWKDVQDQNVNAKHIHAIHRTIVGE